MKIIWTIAIGLAVPLIARAFTPGRDITGFVISCLLGVGGAILGVTIGRVVGIAPLGAPLSYVFAASGAIVLLLLFSYLAPATRPPKSASL